jgi:uncharacterized protein YcbX
MSICAVFQLASDASLYDLNRRLASKPASGSPSAAPLSIPMRSFRPNITVGAAAGGLVAWEEDLWHTIKIGQALVCRACKPCSRCGIPTVRFVLRPPFILLCALDNAVCTRSVFQVDPSTGTRRAVPEPTQTMRTFREVNGDVYFGQNLIHTAPSASAGFQTVVRVADEVSVMKRKTHFFEDRESIKQSNVKLPRL